MKKIVFVLLTVLLFSSCLVTTRPVQSPRYFVVEPPRYYNWYTYPYHHPTYAPYHYNYNNHNHHNHNHNPRPRHYGPRR